MPISITRFAGLLSLLLVMRSAIGWSAGPTVEVRLGHALDNPAAVVELFRLAEEFGAGPNASRVLVGKLGTPGFTRAEVHLALLQDDDDLDRALGGRPVRPLAAVMSKSGVRLDQGRINTALRQAASDEKGNLRALPIAHFLPSLYVNADMARAAGVALQGTPRTWAELQGLAGALYERGVACPYASSWPVWVHLENTSARHGEAFSGGDGRALKLNFNNLVQVKHLARMSSWRQSRYLHLFGEADEADGAFRAGTCAILTSGSQIATRLRREAPFDFKVGELPYYDDVPGASTGRLVPAGGSLWVLAGANAATERAAARFVAHLAELEAQRRWVDASGYLPLLRELGTVRERSPEAREAPAIEMSGRRALPAARDRLGASYERVMAIIREELNEVWVRGKAPKEALDEAVRRGNGQLERGTAPASR